MAVTHHFIQRKAFLGLLLAACLITAITSQVYIGSPCTNHVDCVRYCAYSKYGVEGASCCFPEKIRVSKTEWVQTGSTSCYCCALPDKLSSLNVTDKMYFEGEDEISFATHASTTSSSPVVMGSANACRAYLEAGQADTSPANVRVKGEFCSKKCVQVMTNVKLSFEFPSVCRSRKFPAI